MAQYSRRCELLGWTELEWFDGGSTPPCRKDLLAAAGGRFSRCRLLLRPCLRFQPLDKNLTRTGSQVDKTNSRLTLRILPYYFGCGHERARGVWQQAMQGKEAGRGQGQLAANGSAAIAQVHNDHGCAASRPS